MTTDEKWEGRWKRLKKYIQDDMEICEQRERRAAERGNENTSNEWYMAAKTGRQIFDKMARLEKEEK